MFLETQKVEQFWSIFDKKLDIFTADGGREKKKRFPPRKYNVIFWRKLSKII